MWVYLSPLFLSLSSDTQQMLHKPTSQWFQSAWKSIQLRLQFYLWLNEYTQGFEPNNFITPPKTNGQSHGPLKVPSPELWSRSSNVSSVNSFISDDVSNLATRDLR